MKANILLVDSNADFRTRSTSLLRDKGFAVFEARSLSTAAEVLDRETIDILCIDAYVAGESGLDFLSSPEWREGDYQVAFICNPDRRDDLKRLEDASIDMLLHRPVSAEELVYKVETLISLRALEAHPIDEVPPEANWEDDFFDSSAKTELQERYGEKIPSLFAEIGRRLVQASISGARSSLADLEEAQRIAHMLNGTAGSIGFSEVSAAAHSLEARLKETVRMRRLTSVPALHPVENVEELSLPPPETSAGNTKANIARVLVLDDDIDFLKTVEVMGRENLIHVHTALTGADALRVARSNTLDAAVIDIGLAKDDDPFKIARQLRLLKGNGQLPVAFISVDSSLPKRIAAVHSGAVLFLRKPLDSETFAAAVGRLVPIRDEVSPKILVVDDDKDFLSHITLLFQAEGIETATLTTATNIVEEIDSINPDLVLLDIVMDSVNGLDACRVLRSVDRWRDIPILVLTVHGNRDVLLECINAGADDYIEKPVIREELMARIKLRLERIRMFKERADIDALTGLPTRRPFIDLLKMRLSESARFNKPVSLCLIDLDHFKEINDTYGHLAGDRVLSNVGRLLKRRFRTIDVRGRWGGEEFVVAFYGEEEVTAKMIITRILEEMREMIFTGDHGEVFHVTFSAGVASYPKAGQTVEELFRKVDKNLYRAKNNGRNRIEV